MKKYLFYSTIITGLMFSNFLTENITNVYATNSNLNTNTQSSIFSPNETNNGINISINNGYLDFEGQEPPFIEDGRTLVPLRSIFEALNATVEWDNETRTVIATNAEGTEITMTIDEKYYYLDGSRRTLDVAPQIVNGRTMIPVRAVSESLGCTVDWNDESQTVVINTSNLPPYLNGDVSVNILDNSQKNNNNLFTSSKSRWSSIVYKYYYIKNNVEYFVIADNDTVSIKSVDGSFSKIISCELSTFGGFHYDDASDVFYIIYGTSNPDETPTKEVVRVVKYDSNLNKVSSLSLNSNDTYTNSAFSSGSLRMATNNDVLYVHTSRKRLLSSDGLNHQSQLTLHIDTKKMTMLTDVEKYQGNHVSHSFNQFVLWDSQKNRFMVLDHGDAYPRSICIQDPSTSKTERITLLEIPGNVGANSTGVTIGGFVDSTNSYICAINRVDWDKVTHFSTSKLEGLDIEERDIILLVSNKNTNKVNEVTLAKYIGTGKTGSVPQIVKISDNKFMVIWQEFTADSTTPAMQQESDLKYVFVDGDGKTTSSIYTEPNLLMLTDDCDAVYNSKTNTVNWITDSTYGQILVSIKVK